MPFLLGSGSQCDVCLETFSSEERAPCSIECGHVFCLKCLNSLTRSKCPLCRQRFDPRSLVKLHIDVDEVRSPSSAQDRPGEGEDDLVARKFQERIAAAANEGTTEQNVRQLIDECKSFLTQQPRNNFSDLRVSLRMISYVCEIKTTLLARRQEVKRLTDETEKLQATISNMQDDMTRDRENWQALEMNLRDYCSKAQGAYFGVAELYLKAENERTLLRDTLRQLGYNAPYTLPTDLANPAVQGPVPTGSPPLSDLPPPSGGDLFSPIPELNDAELPPGTVSMANISLLTEGEIGSAKIPIAPMRRCGKVGCPFSCDCQSIDLFDDPSRLLSSVTQVASHATGGHQYLPTPTAAQPAHAHPDLPPDASIQPGPSAPVSGRSGLSLTAPSSSQREKYSHSTSSSRVSTRPVTPEGDFGTSVTNPRTIPAPPPGRMPSYHVVNPRLHDISAAESARSSSSLPNISMSGSHFPASLSAKQVEQPDASSSSKSRSGSPHRSSAARVPRADLSVTPIKDVDNRLSSGSQPRSTASEAAKALERQHRERERSQHKEKAGDGDSSRGRRAKERDSPKSVESNALESSRPRSRSSRREEGSGSTRSRTKASRSEAISSSTTYAPSVSPGPSRTPTNIYAPVAPITTPTWTYAQSQSQHMYQSSIGKGKMMAASIKPVTATLAS